MCPDMKDTGSYDEDEHSDNVWEVGDVFPSLGCTKKGRGLFTCGNMPTLSLFSILNDSFLEYY